MWGTTYWRECYFKISQPENNSPFFSPKYLSDVNALAALVSYGLTFLKFLSAVKT